VTLINSRDESFHAIQRHFAFLLYKLFLFYCLMHSIIYYRPTLLIRLLTPEINPSAQRCRTRFLTGDFDS
jgi:hypothetical protein